MAEGRTAVLVALIAGGTAMISGALGAGLQGYFSQDQRLREQVRAERSTAFINFLVEGQNTQVSVQQRLALFGTGEVLRSVAAANRADATATHGGQRAQLIARENPATVEIVISRARMIRAMRGGLGAEDVSETDIASILCPAPAPCYGAGYYVSHLFQGR